MSETTEPTTEQPEEQENQQEHAGDEALRAEGLAALKRERDARKAAAAERDALAEKLREYEDRDKTEAQRASEALAAAQAERERLAAENLRLTVLHRHSIPADYADLVHGSDEEQLEASAAKLQTLLSTRKPESQSVPALDKPAPKSAAGISIQDQMKAAAEGGDAEAALRLKVLSLGNA